MTDLNYTDGKAILVGHKVQEVQDFMQWAEWFESNDRRVKLTVLNRRRGIDVSTVLLGIDHGFGGPKLWFETLVFGSSIDGKMARYATWDEAVRGHEKMVAIAKNARQVRHKKLNIRHTRRLLRQIKRGYL